MSNTNTSIADLVGSSKYNAIADDSLKDEDNAAWVMFLPRQIAGEWIAVISWLRLIDRMAENEWLEGWGSRLQIFRIGWRALLVTGQVLPDDYHANLLTQMQRRWGDHAHGGMAHFSPMSRERAPGPLASLTNSLINCET
jgi:phytoene synthase